MHRPHSDTLAATVNFKDRLKAKKRIELFENIWLNAEPAFDARYLIL
jgi:hypothetical protein